MIFIGVLLSGVSQRNIHPKGCIGVLKRLPQLFDIYQYCSGVHPIYVPGHICLDGVDKPSYNTQQLQGRVVRDL